MIVNFTDQDLIAQSGWPVWKQGKEQSQIFEHIKISSQAVSGILKEGRKKILTSVKLEGSDFVPHCSCPQYYQTHGFCSHSVALLLQCREAKEIEQPKENEKDTEQDYSVEVKLTMPLAEVLQKKVFSFHVTVKEEAGNGASLKPLLALLPSAKIGEHLIQLPLSSLSELLYLNAKTPFIEGLLGNHLASRFPISFERTGEDIRLQAPLLSEWAYHQVGAYHLLVQQGAYHLQASESLSPELIELLKGETLSINVEQYFTHLTSLQNWFDLTALDAQLQATLSPQEPLFSIHLEGTVKKVQAKLRVHYLGQEAPLDHQFHFLKYEDGQILVNNTKEEQAALALLTQSGITDYSDLEGEGEILEFLAYTLPRLVALGWEVTMMGSFRALAHNVTNLSLRLQVDPFDPQDEFASVQYSFETEEGQGMKSGDAQRLIQSGKQSFKMKSGRVALVSHKEYELITTALQDCEPRQSSGKYLIPTSEVPYLLALGIRSKGEIPTTPSAKAELPSLPIIERLRDYQRDGVSWLLSCMERYRCALLADDMGLGKTIQSITIIEALAAQESTLIVCPASLIPNWRAELEKWLPQQDLSKVQIVSYQLYLRQAGTHHSDTYTLCIIDEASMIKNPESKVSQALSQQPAQYKLALTGTPIENTAGDLWSIFRFLRPKYLGSKAKFHERFVKPLKTPGYTAELTQKRLKAKLEPLVLRRTKQHVLTELPPKTYRVDYCAPNEFQLKEFTRIKAEYEALQADDELNQAQILTSILRMRQVADDPGLLSDNFTQYAPKVNRLLQILEQAKALNKKVLVFSQFAQMLKVLKTQLQENDYRCSLLIGETRDREEEIRSFNDENDVFLISLKAGGYGLNLTAASIVVHFDPWWNPAVENQATDRAYRMGQSEPVSVIKLITQNSIEERILKLQTTKQDLYSTTIDENSSSGITQAELKALMS